MGEELAVIEGEGDVIADALRTAALGGNGNEPHREMFVDITADGLETPASSVDAAQRSYCTLSSELFDRLSVFEPTAALFPVVEVLDWLEWLAGADPITLSFVGEPGAAMASQLRLVGRHSKVAVDCAVDPALLDEIELSLPDRFDGGVFLDDGGDPVPTRIETTAAELARLVGAARRCGLDRYPLTVTAGQVNFGLTDGGTQVEGQLDATVDGPGFAEEFGSSFGRVVRAVDGTVTLYTGPDQPLAVVTTVPGAIFRHVVHAV
ncbi:MAG: hypothetical protein V5A52_07640 [Halovenus sp.]